MVCVKLTFIVFCCVLKVYTLDVNGTEQYAPHISAILKHLNSNPNKIYDYQKGIFINAQQKANIVELTTDVDVACTVNYPGVPCTEQTLTCHGFVQYSEGEYRVLSDVLCNPKQDSSIENISERRTDATVSQQDSKIELSHEAVPSDQNADFVAVKADSVPCVGCPFDLNTDVDGVPVLVDTALRHIETEKNQKHVAIKVVRLQQQVVAGIKYILTIEVAPTVCQKDVDTYSTNCPLDTNVDSSICEITFLQKPWISKDKYIIGNNCTSSQEYPTESRRNGRNDISNEIHSTKPYDDKKEMNSQRLSDLESQILNLEPENVKPVTKNVFQTNQYPKKVLYQEVIGNPSNNQLYTAYGIQNTIKYEPLATSYQPDNSFSTSAVNVVQQNIPTEKSIDNGEEIDDKLTVEEFQQTTKQVDNEGSENLSKTEGDNINTQDPSRQKRENNFSFEEKLEKFKRELNSPVTDTSESSDTREDDSKTNRVVRQSNFRKAQDLNNAGSSSSESHEDNTGEKIERLRRNSNNPSSKSSESSESHEDNKTDHVIPKSYLRTKRDLGNSDSKSSESKEDNTGEKITSKRNVDHIPFEEKLERFKRELNSPVTDTSESSDTREDDSKTNRIVRQSDFRKARDLNNAGSSSSESHEDNTGEKLERFRRNSNNPSSESSESSESREDNKTNSTIPKTVYRIGRDLTNSNSKSSESKEDNTEEKITSKRNVDQIPFEEKLERFRRELNSPVTDTSESSDTREDDSKTNRVVRESNFRKARDINNAGSSSSESHEDNTGEKFERLKRNPNNPSSESSESSESHEENQTDHAIPKSYIKKASESSDSDSSESDEHKTRLKRNKDFSSTNIRIKRKNNDNSSSSSESDSSENKSKEKEDKKKNDDSNDTSSSSSSSEDKSKEKQTNGNKNENDSSSSSSSSSSSEEKSKQDGLIKRDIDDRNDIDININRVKRSIGQLEKITQEEKFLVRDLADFAAYSLDKIDDDNHKRVILQILSAKKLKLDGIYYHIILRLGVSHCSEYEEDEICREKLFTNLTKICKVLVHVEDDLSNPKVVKSQCQNIKKDDRDRNRTNYSRYRRDLLEGAPWNISLDDPRVLEFTRDTLTELDSQSEHPNKHKLIKVVSATSQIVAGAKYEIKIVISLSDCLKNDTKSLDECDLPQNSTTKTCDIVVWDRPWLPHRETKVKCDDRDKQYTFERTNPRRNRSLKNKFVFDKADSEKPAETKDNPKALGGIEEQSPDDVKASKYLRDILTYLDDKSGHSNKLKINEILSVDKQVVAGELWRIKARITLSDCPQTASVDPQLCEELEGSESRTCVFKIWDRPWLPHGKEVQTSCENEPKPYSFRLKRSISDSPSNDLSIINIIISNPKVLKYVKTGLGYLDSQSSHETKYMVRSIKKMSKQTVAGQLWHVTAEITLSDCLKQYHIQYCEELEGGEPKSCDFVIWDQPWLSNGLQINITCENDSNLYSYSPKSVPQSNILQNDELLVKFNDFMIKHNKSYPSDTEYNYRLKVFRDNLNTIKLLNIYEQGTGQYGVTRFADLTSHEFSKSHGLRTDLRSENEAPFSDAIIPDIEPPTEFDWRTKGAVTEVKNQGSCGSCWAFSTTGNIEGQYAIKYGKLLEFSEQELVDCDKFDEGCNGGLMDNAYRTIEKIGGLETESDYPYDAEDEKCHFNKSKVRVQLSGAVNISHNEVDMAKWLVKNGPISIAINANAMQFYMGGVSHPWKLLCNPKNLDHGVLIVGYGVHNYPKFNKTLPYWIVKNSWGHSWGEQGYYRVYRGDGTCGLNQTPSSGIVA